MGTPSMSLNAVILTCLQEVFSSIEQALEFGSRQFFLVPTPIVSSVRVASLLLPELEIELTPKLLPFFGCEALLEFSEVGLVSALT